MLQLLDAKERLYPVLSESGGMNLSIKIAGDNEVAEGAPECAIVTASYEMEGAIGSAGVIGPMRVDYKKIIPYIEYLTHKITALMSEDDNTDAETVIIDDSAERSSND